MNEDYPVKGPDYFEGHENTVHTLLYLLYLVGRADALKNASELIHSHNSYETNACQTFLVEKLVEGKDGDAIWFDIAMDNFIPQIYKKLYTIDGLGPIVFAFHCDYDKVLYTNDTKGIITGRRELFGIPADLEVESIDYYLGTFDLASSNYNS